MSNLLIKELKRSKYRLLGLVGQGQFGRVYCASHRRTGHLFALKELDKERFPTHKFLRELRFLLSLQHSNIVTCHALEHTRTGRYLVMDYCEGGTLRSLMEEDIRLHPNQCLKLVADILAGLDHAHGRGIIHCDIKPENILLTLRPDGWTARISDFGIARLSQEITKDGTGNTGSPAYMAPERFYGQHSHSSDLYAVGVLLFELLAGYRPFSGLPAELMGAHLNRPVKLPETIPTALQTIILTALQKLPARRFRSAAEMLTAIEAVRRMEIDFGAAWTPTNLLQPTLQVPDCAFKALREEVLEGEVRQLVGVAREMVPLSATVAIAGLKEPEVLPEAAPNLKTESIYRVLRNRIGCQDYRGGLLNVEFNSASSGEVPLTTVRLPETVQELVVRPQGCFAIAQKSVYLLPNDLFKPGTAQHGQKRLQLGPEAAGHPHFVPQLIAELSNGFLATIAPEGQWMVTAVSEPNSIKRSLQIWNWSCAHPISISRSFTHLFQLLALDSRHFVAFAHTVDLQSNVCITGARAEVFTRRGTSVGTLNLSVPLHRIMVGSMPHQLVATEPGQQNSFLLLDLKPLKISRIGLEIVPALITTAAWGYVLISDKGEILLLDKYGQGIGQMNGPANPTAMTILGSHALLIATWQGGTGTLYTVDLRQLDLSF